MRLSNFFCVITFNFSQVIIKVIITVIILLDWKNSYRFFIFFYYNKKIDII